MEQSIPVFLLLAFGVSAIILTGVPVAYGLGAFGLTVSVFVVGTHTLPLLGIVAYGEVDNYSLIAIPLFLFTADILAQAEISDRAFSVFARRLRRIPASLAIASNILSTIFAAIVGSSAGNTAIMGRVALRPMISRGYSPGLASGVVVAGGALGVLIPPSTLMILYGVVTEVSVGQLLIGGLVPGLMISAAMTLYLLAVGFFRPSIAGGASDSRADAAADLAPLSMGGPNAPGVIGDIRSVLPIVLLLLSMTLAIYMGFATASEIAAIGGAAAIFIVTGYRRLTLTTFRSSLMRTAHTSAMILLIVVMAAYLGRLLAFMNIGPIIVEEVRALGWSPMAVVFGVNIILMVLACFMDSAAIILVFGPLFHMLMESLGLDPLWWAVVFVINMEIGLLTPPFGINLFVLKSIAPDIPMAEIIRGVLPLIAIQILCLLILILVPDIITWLPRKMI